MISALLPHPPYHREAAVRTLCLLSLAGELLKWASSLVCITPSGLVHRTRCYHLFDEQLPLNKGRT